MISRDYYFDGFVFCDKILKNYLYFKLHWNHKQLINVTLILKISVSKFSITRNVWSKSANVLNTGNIKPDAKHQNIHFRKRVFDKDRQPFINHWKRPLKGFFQPIIKIWCSSSYSEWTNVAQLRISLGLLGLKQ